MVDGRRGLRADRTCGYRETCGGLEIEVAQIKGNVPYRAVCCNTLRRGAPANLPYYVTSIAGSSIRRSSVSSQANPARGRFPESGTSRAAMEPFRNAYGGFQGQQGRQHPAEVRLVSDQCHLPRAGTHVQDRVEPVHVEARGSCGATATSPSYWSVSDRISAVCTARTKGLVNIRVGRAPASRIAGPSPGTTCAPPLRYRAASASRGPGSPTRHDEPDRSASPALPPSVSRNRSTSMAARQPGPRRGDRLAVHRVVHVPGGEHAVDAGPGPLAQDDVPVVERQAALEDLRVRVVSDGDEDAVHLPDRFRAVPGALQADRGDLVLLGVEDVRHHDVQGKFDLRVLPGPVEEDLR